MSFIPEPSADQLLPSHLAMFVAALPPAVVKAPPAYRSLPETASAYTLPFIPEPSAVQVLPSHLAMSLAALPPAILKRPPAYTLLPETASEYTKGSEEVSPTSPKPNGDQLVPFHLAMELAALPPAVVKTPPTYKSLPDNASAHTPPFIPEP